MAKLSEIVNKNQMIKKIFKRVNGFSIEVKSIVDAETYISAVQTVVQSCFVDGEFRAENREIARRYVILKYFTDIEIDGDTDVAEIFKTTQGGNWYAQIEADVVKLPVWGEVETAIDKQIDYIIATRQTAFDKLCADLSAIIKTDNTQNLADVKEVLEKLSDVDEKKFVEAAVDNAVKKTKKK